MPLLHHLKLATPMPIRNLFRPIAYQIEKLLQSRRLRALYRTFVRPGDLVFDLGAHQGEHSEHFLALGARDLALEPLPVCWPAMRNLFTHSTRFVALAYAVGETEGMAELCIPEVPAHATINPAHQRARFPREDFSRTIHVQRTTLDSLITQYGLPDYIKIDTEGSELPILKGLSHRPRFISFEFSMENLDQAAECASRITPAMFNLSLYSNQRLHLKEWISHHDLVQILLDHPDQKLCGDIFARLG